MPKIPAISVLVPAYNAAKTIADTLSSVLSQSQPASEILVVDDGSTDSTATVVESFGPKVTLIRQENRGAAAARNLLCSRAKGDLIAFLDSDDQWHPRYLETQLCLHAKLPEAAANFVGHFTFVNNFSWNESDLGLEASTQQISAINFVERYSKAPGDFGPSFCCVPKWALEALGPEPFQFSIAEDCYFFNLIALVGPVQFYPAKLVAYRKTPGSLSSNRLRLSKDVVRVFEALEPRYRQFPNAALHLKFLRMFALKRYVLAKVLLNVDERQEARKQLIKALQTPSELSFRLRAFIVLLSTLLPKGLRPDWLSQHAEWKMH